MALTNTAANAPAPTANAPAQNASKSTTGANAVPAAPAAASGGFLSGLTSLFATKPAATVPCKCPTCGNDHTRPAPTPAQTGAGRRSRRNRKNRKNSRKDRKNSRKD